METRKLFRDAIFENRKPCVVDDDPVWLSSLACQLDKDAVEHAKAAPTDEPVIDRLVRPEGSRCISPPQPVLDDEDKRRHNQPVIDPWNTMR